MVRFDTWRVVERIEDGESCWVVLDRADRVCSKQATRDAAVAMVLRFQEIAEDVGTFHRRLHNDRRRQWL